MGRPDINLAREPIVLPADKEVAPTEADQKALESAAKRLFHDAAGSVVEVRTSKGAGSGFFVDDDGRIVTNWHVVKDSPYLTVMTNDAMNHPAKIEKVDDINDLAIIRIDDAARGTFKPLQLGNDLPSNSTAFLVGHPLGEPRVHIAPGKVQHVTTQLDASCNDRAGKLAEQFRQDLERYKRTLDLLTGVESKGPPLEDCNQRFNSMLAKLDPQLQSDGRQWLNRPAVPALLPAFPGNSGGPLIGENGKVAGVARITSRGDYASSSFAPVSAVKQLLEGNSKFDFQYKYHNESPNAVRYMNWWDKQPVGAGAATITAAAISGAALRYVPRLGLAAGAIIGGAKLASDDLDDLSYWDGGPRGRKEMLSLGADASMIVGGIMTAMPRFRLAGMAIATVGGLGRIGTEFIPTYPVLEKMTRTDGSKREPFDSKHFGVE